MAKVIGKVGKVGRPMKPMKTVEPVKTVKVGKVAPDLRFRNVEEFWRYVRGLPDKGAAFLRERVLNTPERVRAVEIADSLVGGARGIWAPITAKWRRDGSTRWLTRG